MKLNPIASLVPQAANFSSIPLRCQKTYLKKNNKKDEWLPLKYKTVVCCFISYKKLSNKELFEFKIVLFILYILLIYDDLFHRIVNIAVF